MKNSYKVIFIGAGVSNLAAANRLLDYSINDFILIEQGNALNNRKCPTEDVESCIMCQDGCSTLEGVGGANALHGNKLCYFPASNGILNSFDNNEIDLATNFLNDLAFPYFDKSFITNEVKHNNKKYYSSDVLNKKNFALLIDKLTQPLNNKIITKTKVVEIEKESEGFCVQTANGQTFFCETLILGTGRSSYNFIPNQLKKLNVDYDYQIQDIGIRIEAHKDCFTEDYYYQVDPKFKYNWEGLGSARTFCAHNQGRVVPVNFGNSFFADGAFENEFGSQNNIALMVRGLHPLSIEELENWCKAINIQSKNNLLLGSIKLNQSEGEIINQILDLVNIFPTKSHKTLLENLLSEIFSGKHKLLKIENNFNSILNIYGPAIDRQWAVPAVDKNFQIKNIENLFVLGDAIGQSRGFIQAMFSGAIWADRLFKVITSQKMTACLNLV